MKNSNISIKTKIIAKVMSVIIILSVTGNSAVNVKASAPHVTVDETAYVNLDYYGNISDASIVKGCSLNGLTKFKDYGTYESVTNMSGYDKPAFTDEGVEWNLSNLPDSKRFYFNCKLKNDALKLPWNIDVSYKLNGVPCSAEKLAGASGLIEIDIDAIPNDNAAEYFKNNMLLQTATYINAEDAYSIDAPGSQLQSAGIYKGVVFTALPGEESHFSIRIGTDSFETNGVTFVIIPGTLKQFEKIKELKEAKDTIHDSSEKIYKSMDEILTTLESMKEGLAGLKEGSEELEDARKTLSSGKDTMDKNADEVIADMSDTNEKLKNMIPYFKIARDDIKNLNSDINDAIKTLDKMKKPLSVINLKISKMQKDLKDMQSDLNILDDQIKSLLENLEMVSGYDLTSQLKEYTTAVNNLLSEMITIGNSTAGIINVMKELIKDADNLKRTLNLCENSISNFLNDSEDFVLLMSNSINSMLGFLTYSKSLFKESGDKFDSAIEKSLKNMIELLDKSLQGLENISDLKSANRSIKTTVYEEFEKIERENNFLNIDPDAKFVSLTSDRNPSPTSIQIVLRTQEITLNTSGASENDLEDGHKDIGFRRRIANLLKKMASAF